MEHFLPLSDGYEQEIPGEKRVVWTGNTQEPAKIQLWVNEVLDDEASFEVYHVGPVEVMGDLFTMGRLKQRFGFNVASLVDALGIIHSVWKDAQKSK